MIRVKTDREDLVLLEVEKLLLARVDALSMHNSDNLAHAFVTRHLHCSDGALVGERRGGVQAESDDPQPTDAP